MADRKIHLSTNKGLNGNSLVAICAGTVRNNRIVRNGRQTYQFMCSEIVRWDAFKQLDRADMCAHCVEAGLIARNKQRRALGRTPVTDLFA